MRSFYSPLSISAPFYGYLKLRSYNESKEVETRMRDPGIELWTSCTKAAHLPVEFANLLNNVLLVLAKTTIASPSSFWFLLRFASKRKQKGEKKTTFYKKANSEFAQEVFNMMLLSARHAVLDFYGEKLRDILKNS